MSESQGAWERQKTYVSIADAEGNVEQELSYDAWGNLRNPNTWCVDKTIRPMFDRGYTGHEHLNAFGLINMNGRMYDPQMSSFLSVDAYVQSPDNSQSFNRYAYCLNNPLKYTDPSGWQMVGGTTPSNPFHENWGVNFAEHVVTSHEAREILWNMGISIGIWMEGNAMTGSGGGCSSFASFFDENGIYLGSDEKNNGKIYVIRSEIPEVMFNKEEVLRFFNEGVSSLTINEIYNCFVEIIPSHLGRYRMYNIVSQDDGTGGSAESNNREYGGYIDEYGFVLEINPSEIKTPDQTDKLTINFPYGSKYATFHSHPSGFKIVYDEEARTTHTFSYNQRPTDPDDFIIAGRHVCYVFGRGDGYVYVYNNKGIQSKIQTSVFIDYNKFVRP